MGLKNPSDPNLKWGVPRHSCALHVCIDDGLFASRLAQLPVAFYISALLTDRVEEGYMVCVPVNVDL